MNTSISVFSHLRSVLGIYKDKKNIVNNEFHIFISIIRLTLSHGNLLYILTIITNEVLKSENN